MSTTVGASYGCGLPLFPTAFGQGLVEHVALHISWQPCSVVDLLWFGIDEVHLVGIGPAISFRQVSSSLARLLAVEMARARSTLVVAGSSVSTAQMAGLERVISCKNSFPMSFFYVSWSTSEHVLLQT